MLKMAIIGVGWAGERQVQAVRELGRKVTVTCLVDNDPAFLKSKADELGIHRTYTDYDDALADPEIDAVSICTPHALHCSMALAAAAAGKHILVEKPIALTVADATRMIDAAEAYGVRLYVAENFCYMASSRFLRTAVRTGQYTGELTAVTLVWGFHAPNFGYPGRRAWLTQPASGGTGTWMLHGIHTMAQLRYVFGEVGTVYLREHHTPQFQRPDIEGTMSGLLTLENGLHVSVIQTCETPLKDAAAGYTLYGSQGILRAFKDGCEVIDSAGAVSRHAYPQAKLSEYALEIEAFADYVTGVAEGPTTGRSERRTLAIVEAGYESARSGQPVHLNTRFGRL